MDDVDGALFSRISAKNSETDLHTDQFSDTKDSIINDSQGGYSKVQRPKGRLQKHAQLDKARYEHEDEICVKRESMPTLQKCPSIPKGVVYGNENETQPPSSPKPPFKSQGMTQAKPTEKLETLTHLTSVPQKKADEENQSGYPPRNDQIEDIYKENNNTLPDKSDIDDPLCRKAKVLATCDFNAVYADNRQTHPEWHNLPRAPMFARISFENSITDDKVRQEIERKQTRTPGSNSSDSSSSSGYTESDWDGDHAGNNQQGSSTSLVKSKQLKAEKEALLKCDPVLHNTEIDIKSRKELPGCIDIPSQRSSVFYLNDDSESNENEQNVLTEMKLQENLENSNSADTTRDNNKYRTKHNYDLSNEEKYNEPDRYGIDVTDAKCADDTINITFDNKTEMLSNTKIFTDISDHTSVLKSDINMKKQKRIKWHVARGLAFPLISLSIYIWDIGSDIRLAITYRDNGEMNLFWITLACIVVPLILMSVVDVSWLWLDRPPCIPRHMLRYVLGVLTLGRVVRAIKFMRHIVKSITLSKEEERTWHKKRAIEEKRDCLMLDFINAFAESAPQLFVQLYLLYTYDLELTVIRILNLLSSWISIAWTYAAYYRCNREALVGIQEVNITGFAFFFSSVLSALAARVICVVLFLVYFKTWIGAITLAVHFISMFLWIFLKEKPKLEGTASSTFGRYLYYSFFAYVSLLCFLNLRDTRAKFRMTAFYLLVYVENFTMAALSFYKINMSQTGNEKALNLLALPVGLVLHVTLLVTYYQLFHPKTGTCCR